MRYPYEMKPDGDGWFVSFPDIPEALTSGATREEAAEMAADALLTALNFYFDERQAVPAPSKPAEGQLVVELPASVAAKVLLLNEMVAQQIRPSELARRVGVTRQEVNRMTNLKHATKIDALADAFKALNRQLVVASDKAYVLDLRTSANRKALESVSETAPRKVLVVPSDDLEGEPVSAVAFIDEDKNWLKVMVPGNPLPFEIERAELPGILKRAAKAMSAPVST